jgi:hypothetical protein
VRGRRAKKEPSKTCSASNHDLIKLNSGQKLFVLFAKSAFNCESQDGGVRRNLFAPRRLAREII